MSERLPVGRPAADASDDPRTDRTDGDSPSRIMGSDELFAGRSQLTIRHHDTVYFLRQTRFGKLILTK